MLYRFFAGQMILNANVDLGSILAALSIIVTLVVLHVSNVRRIARMEERVELMYQWWKRQL